MNIDVALLSRTLPSHEAWLALLSFSQEGDMVKAAQKLHLTQPALSFHLKKLEDQLGFRLFTFSGKKKILTKLGQEYVRQVAKVLHDAQLATERVSRLGQSLESQKIRIAGRRELMIPFLSFPFPGQIEFIQTSSAEALSMLREHKVDLAVSARMQDSSEFLAKLFFESQLQLIYPKSWNKGKSISEEELQSRPVIAYGTHSAYLRDYLKLAGKKLQQMNVSRVVEDWFSVVELVRYGFGWAVIPDAWGVHTDEVVQVQVHKERIAPQRIYLFYRKEERKSLWAQKLDEWLAK